VRPLAGGAFYDEPTVFHQYSSHRASPTNPNDLVEEPALLDLLGSVRDKRVLDLGCGTGTFGRSLLQAGCHSYVGIDASLNMVTAAQQILQGTRRSGTPREHRAILG
jgi:trans-aconitate methyltransferase